MPGVYFPVLKDQYFFDVIDMVNEKYSQNTCVYLFSDDFKYVENEILPKLKSKTQNLQLVFGNKDYMDLFLYSLCNVQIASQSSWGQFAYIYNVCKERLLVKPTNNIQMDTEKYSDEIKRGEVIMFDLKKHPEYVV